MNRTRMYRIAVIIAFFFLISPGLLKCQVKTEIDWPSFMAQHDLIWEELPLQWNEGAFTGNGQIGLMIYANLKDNRIDFHLGRQDVTDHRKAPGRKTSMGAEGATVMLDYPRLDIGRMLLRPAGKILSGTMRINLWNAEISGKIKTDLGEISFNAFIPHDSMLSVIEVTSTENKNKKNASWKWDFLPGNPASPRVQTRPDQNRVKGYISNPNPVIQKTGDVSVCVQSLLAGGDYATAWTEKKDHGLSKSILFVSTANEVPKSNVSEIVAKQTILEASKNDVESLKIPHQNWWHRFYQQSFITIPDTRMESFFWIQMYKIAVSSRPDGPAVDLFGPVFRVSQWPGLWWNLNVQLTYWPFYASNHLDLAENLNLLIDEQFDALLESFRGEKLGDYGWVMHNYWLYYKYLGDMESIQQKWVPKAIKVVEAYQDMMQENPSGQIELLPMGSPEYQSFTLFPNTNYNLAIVRWLLNSLIESNEKYNSNRQNIEEWKQLLAKLVPFPTNENGLMIGSNQPFDMSHRHYSHLLGLYPLFQLNPEDKNDCQLLEKSLMHWHKIENGEKLTGYSFTGAASMYAALGMGNKSEELLNQFLDGKGGRSLFFPNTMYTESRGKNPTIETPLSAAASIMELLIQSWGNKIRIFPAVPEKWEDAAFYHLRAQGGFLVSASRKQGKTEWVSVKSLSGEPCIIKIPDWEQAVQINKDNNISIAKLAEGEFKIDLNSGEEIVLVSERKNTGIIVKSITHSSKEKNFYGVKKGQQLPEDLSWPLPEFKLE